MSAPPRPTVLLVPGILNDASLWDEVAAALAPHADVRRVPVLAQATVPAMADAAWAQLAGLPPAAPVLLAGFSLGGYVALEMLARPLRPLQAAALISTSPRPESAEARAAREKTIGALERRFEQVVDGILQWGTHKAPPALHARLKAMMLRVGAATAVRQNRATMERSDHRAALSQLELPVAVLCGLQDRITPPELARELAALIPGATLQLVDGAGHMLPAERPAAVAAALRALLPRQNEDEETPCKDVP